MTTTFRHLDTSGLPAGFDIADLVAPGITDAQLRDWCRERRRDGPIPAPGPKPIPSPVQKNTPADEGNREPGRNAIQPGRGKPHAKPDTVKAAVSTAPASNVVAMRQPEAEQLLDIPPEYSDDALADLFSTRYAAELSYVNKWGRWMQWQDGQWTHDETLRTRDLARQVARKAAAEATNNTQIKNPARVANTISSSRTIGAIELLARADRRHAATAEQWDRDPWALNTPGGIVNLQDGTIRPARKDDFATKITRVAPGGPCPNWLRFLQVSTDGDDELVAFMRRMAGYCLTGITREHALFFVYGAGGNGKGTFLNTMDWILNSYAKAANMEMFVEQKFQKHAQEVASLMGARMVTAQESEEGKRWHESRLKAFTGGDPITANFMRQDDFTFIPQFKLVFAGNHKPALRNVDEAIKRRLFLIPFTVEIPAHVKDLHLKDKLQAEAGGILQWCIEGCLDWQDNMLAPPERVLAMTREYFQEEDLLGQFISECCICDRNMRSTTSSVYARYVRWSEEAGEFTLPRKRWLQQMQMKGATSMKLGGTMMLEGIKLQAVDSDHDAFR